MDLIFLAIFLLGSLMVLTVTNEEGNKEAEFPSSRSQLLMLIPRVSAAALTWSGVSAVSTSPQVSSLSSAEMAEAEAGTEMEAGCGENMMTGSPRICWRWLL